MSEYYRIGTIAKLYEIGVDSLKYYEKRHIIAPKREASGYRLYTVDDIKRLNVVRELREIGMSVDEIRTYLDQPTLSSTMQMINEQTAVIEKKRKTLLLLQQKLLRRAANLSELQNKKHPSTFHIKTIPGRKILILNENTTRYQDVDFLLKKLNKKHHDQVFFIGNSNIGAISPLEKIKNNQYGHFSSVFCMTEDDSLFDAELAPGRYMCTLHCGEYGEIANTMQQLLAEVEKRHYRVVGNPIEIYLIDEHDTGDPAEYLTELQVQIAK